jgi:hydroxyacylglutathione hydrolase
MLQVKYAAQCQIDHGWRYCMLSVRPVPAFQDNYIWLIDSPRAAGSVVVVDPGDAAPVLQALRATGSRLAAILITHHHADHIGGLGELVAATGAPAIGPADERIGGLTRTVGDGEELQLPELGLRFQILAVPGHTLSHIAYSGHGALFVGDTLFSAGCGRLFEGTATQMAESLAKLSALAAEAQVYCGHEYTASNLKFALAVEPSNPDTLAYSAAVNAWRAQGRPSLPSNLALEIRVNPFLRCAVPAVKSAAEAHAGRSLPTPTEVFATLRSWKDGFRSV